MKQFDITKFKTKAEIIKIVQELGDKCLTKTSHSFTEYSNSKILNAAQLSAKNYSTLAKSNPVVGLIVVILAAHRDYNKVVRPNIERIQMEFPDLTTFDQLIHFISKRSRKEFFIFWGPKDDKKYKILISILKAIPFLRKKYPKTIDDYNLMNSWARDADFLKYKTDIIGKIPNMGVATFQHLRMNFGVDTVKPDQRVKEVLEFEFGLSTVNDINNILAVEQIARITNHKVIEIDQVFVNFGSGYYYRRNNKLNTKSIAKNLKELGVPFETIAKATSLTERQILKL